MTAVDWYAASAYCNWLSEREGIPEDQWCYLKNTQGAYAEGMKLAPDYLSRGGYRLPTEAEWEYACRSGAVTSRYYGETEELLGKYAWYTKNSLDRWMLPGPRGQELCLKPNDLGLFDMLGDAFGWCQNRFAPYAPAPGGVASEDRDDATDVPDRISRVLRGGAFSSRSRLVRAAYRDWVLPAARIHFVGFRPARTVAAPGAATSRPAPSAEKSAQFHP